MSATLALVLIDVASTWLMVGVIWMVQVVHYPMFAMADRAGFVGFHRFHTSRITWIVMPAMTIELLSSSALAWRLGSPLTWAGCVCAALTWLLTAALSVPAHNQLAHGFDGAAHRRLVATNWLRTIAFTAHGAVTLALLPTVRA